MTAALAGAADLKITVRDVRSTTGFVFVAVYDSQGAFMKASLARATRKVKANQGSVTLVIPNLPPGTYAVASYHDENANGKMDTNSLGVPTEGYGFSNDAQGTAGPPKFAQAAFEFDAKADKTISFSLNY
jgi:uncharacterized protein (DUF2141 family)